MSEVEMANLRVTRAGRR